MANGDVQKIGLKESSLVTDDDYDDLSGGVRLSFPVLRYRGQMWRMSYQKEELALVDDQGQPVREIGVSLLKVPDNLSKRYFGSLYREGENNAPTCWSDDGKKPHPTAMVPPQPDGRPKPDLCSRCFMDVIGSANTQDKAIRMKACGDYKRMAVRLVYPVFGRVIIQNKWGNDLIPIDQQMELAMLLGVPAGSLKNLSSYGDELRREQVRAIARVTWIGFVPGLSYPKLTFRYGQEFDDETFLQMRALRNDPNTARILERDAAMEDAASEPIEDGNGGSNAPISTISQQTPAQVQVQTPTPIKPVPAQPAVQQQAQPDPTPIRPAFVPGGRPVKPINPINTAINKPAAPPPSLRQVIVNKQEDENTPMPKGLEDEIDKTFNALKLDGKTS
jgi:hypothetical protein